MGWNIYVWCNFSQSNASNILMTQSTLISGPGSLELADGTDSSRIPQSHQGDLCPQCSKGKLDYNGLLELECPVCGFRDIGGASYT
jgi:hypothetical protein